MSDTNSIQTLSRTVFTDGRPYDGRTCTHDELRAWICKFSDCAMCCSLPCLDEFPPCKFALMSSRPVSLP